MITPSDRVVSAARIKFLRNLSPGSHVHVIGVCGTGMAAVAELLKKRGFVVSGSDKAFYPPMGEIVRKNVARVFEGYSADNLAPRPDCVIVGNSIRADNPEAVFARENDLPLASMPEVFSALLIGEREDCQTSVVISGTHGKTTTSALTAVMFAANHKQPGWFIGGAPLDLPGGLEVPGAELPADKRVVVLEGDEYDSAYFAKWSKFQSYRPDIAVLTSLEFDHADIFESLAEIQAEFAEFLSLVPADGHVLYAADAPGVSAFVQQLKIDGKISAALHSYGEQSSEFKLVSRQATTQGQKLKFQLGARGEVEIQTPLSGVYNALNLLAGAAVGALSGLLSLAEIAAGLQAFTGVKRRQNVISDKNGILVLEDFAHHPTAVALTLSGLREKYAGRRLVAAFEPRSNTSRRNIFQREYAQSFDAADLVFLADVGEKSGYSKHAESFQPLDVEKLCAEISARGPKAAAFSSISELEGALSQTLQAGDVLVLMSNGDFGGLPGRMR